MLRTIPFRRFSTQNLHVQKLNRSVLRLNGPDTKVFLQGLITNDIYLLDKVPSIFSFFLDSRGRVLFDVILHNSTNGILLDCDSNGADRLRKHLLMFKLRRKVEITPEDSSVWAVFDPTKSSPQESPDPRLPSLGSRLVSKESPQIPNAIVSTQYQQLRFSQAVAEGTEEIPPGECLPFDLSGDYLNAISFQKGCYIGQELTARTHHTGVVRKRLMPIFFSETPENLKPGAPITNPDSAKALPLGKLRALSGNLGIAVVKVVEALAAPKLQIGSYSVTTKRPSWWPS